MNKQETSALRREASKLRRNLEGIMDMDRLPDALVVIDTNREEIAVAEAVRLKIPVVAIVDTNCDPERSSIPSPAMTTRSGRSGSFCRSSLMPSSKARGFVVRPRRPASSRRLPNEFRCAGFVDQISS